MGPPQQNNVEKEEHNWVKEDLEYQIRNRKQRPLSRQKFRMTWSEPWRKRWFGLEAGTSEKSGSADGTTFIGGILVRVVGVGGAEVPQPPPK